MEMEELLLPEFEQAAKELVVDLNPRVNIR